MKKKRLNSKGFVLVETLVVSVFIMSIFAILYNNLYPLMGEYEKRENYDNVEGKYTAFWVKKIIEHDSTIIPFEKLAELEYVESTPGHRELKSSSDGYFKFTCGMVDSTNNPKLSAMCTQLFESAGIVNAYVLNYDMSLFKAKIDNISRLSGGIHRYVEYLPNYNQFGGSLNYAPYRVIIEMEKTRDGNDFRAYSTIEVKR